MNNIRKQEETLMETLKAITIFDIDGKEFNVRVIYGSEEVITSNITKLLPVLGFITSTIGRHALLLQGTIYTRYRSELNQIAEKLFALEEDNRNLSFGSIKIETIMSKTPDPVHVITGKFTIQISS